LGIPEINARVPLMKMRSNKSDKNYLGLTYVKGIIYLENSQPCNIKWVYSKSQALYSKSKKLEPELN
jgi:hypothetical protein